MSLEQFLLIAFLVVLPLMQYAMQMARKRNELPEQTKGLPPSAKPAAMQNVQPALPQNARPAASRETIAPMEYTDMRVGPTAVRSAAVTGLGNPFDSRRAIVLLTLIGPCRAVSPHGRLDNDGRE